MSDKSNSKVKYHGTMQRDLKMLKNLFGDGKNHKKMLKDKIILYIMMFQILILKLLNEYGMLKLTNVSVKKSNQIYKKLILK